MKKVVLFFALSLLFGFCYANTTQPKYQKAPKKGDVLVVNHQSGQKYNHIDFPRLNFIVKRGGLANYKSVHGIHVIVKEVVETDGNTHVILERKDGKKFFGFLKDVKANYTKSINSKEFLPYN